jgi:hypothetical protein
MKRVAGAFGTARARTRRSARDRARLDRLHRQLHGIGQLAAVGIRPRTIRIVRAEITAQIKTLLRGG